MENRQKCLDGNKRYASLMSQVDSTVAPLQFNIGTIQGTQVHGFSFMAVILFSNTIFEDVAVISLIMQPDEEVPVLIENVVSKTLQVHDLKDGPVQMLEDEKGNTL